MARHQSAIGRIGAVSEAFLEDGHAGARGQCHRGGSRRENQGGIGTALLVHDGEQQVVGGAAARHLAVQRSMRLYGMDLRAQGIRHGHERAELCGQ